MKEQNGKILVIVSWLIVVSLVIGGAVFYVRNRPHVTVLYPNGGEIIKIGQKYTIKWETTGFSPSDKVYIRLYDNARHCPAVEGCWNSSVIGVGPNTGSYVWDTSLKMFGDAGPNSVSVVPKNSYKIEIIVESSSNHELKVLDRSNKTFVTVN